jgi:hypothetical protein
MVRSILCCFNNKKFRKERVMFKKYFLRSFRRREIKIKGMIKEARARGFRVNDKGPCLVLLPSNCEAEIQILVANPLKIPLDLVRKMNFGKKVIIAGCGGWIEIWDPGKWAEEVKTCNIEILLYSPEPEYDLVKRWLQKQEAKKKSGAAA